MSTVEINGIPIPIATESWTRSFDYVGASADRAIMGEAISGHIAEKWRDSGKTNIMPADEARVIESLINGRGHLWSGANAYSSKGVAHVAGSLFTVAATGGKWGPRLIVNAGNVYAANLLQKMGYNPWSPTLHGWTLATWKYQTAATDGVPSDGYYHFVITSSVTVTRGTANPANVFQYRNGVSGSYGAGMWIDVQASGQVSITGHNAAGTSSQSSYSDFAFFPFVIPSRVRTAWIASVYADAALGAWPALPKLRLTGDAYKIADVGIGMAKSRPVRPMRPASDAPYDLGNLGLDIEIRQV